MSKKKTAYRILMEKLERPLKRERRRWMDNIRMDFGDRMGWLVLD
jgi:hypothetical protein